MNKSELVAKIAKNSSASKAAVEVILNETLKAVTETLKKGDDVRLVGFGTFAVAKRPAKEGRNPRTGAKIKIAACKQPKFKAGKALKDALN
ncbi:MAG: HU family DNA-binding protein [Alphaproteobacteria bacterium]|nr:HU family DNA-binding protein [Alphaproteobacteria bacterium]MBO4643523.1 HU family DNA-binding protein [Alphaproteobacteria bacterium]